MYPQQTRKLPPSPKTDEAKAWISSNGLGEVGLMQGPGQQRCISRDVEQKG